MMVPVPVVTRELRVDLEGREQVLPLVHIEMVEAEFAEDYRRRATEAHPLMEMMLDESSPAPSPPPCEGTSPGSSNVPADSSKS